MANLVDQTRRLLDAAEVSRDKQDEIMAPLYQRVELNYWNAAYGLLSKSLRHKMEATRQSAPPGSSRDPAYEENTNLIHVIDHDQQLLDGVSYDPLRRESSFSDLVVLSGQLLSFKEDDAVRAEMNEIHLDFNHFKEHHSFRRDIDLSPLYRYS